MKKPAKYILSPYRHRVRWIRDFCIRNRIYNSELRVRLTVIRDEQANHAADCAILGFSGGSTFAVLGAEYGMTLL